MGEPEPTPVPGRSPRQAAYLTAGLGIVHAVLLLVSFWILRNMPGPGASEATLNAFYGGADRRRVLAVGLYLLPFAAIAFVWFIVALRMWVGSHGAGGCGPQARRAGPAHQGPRGASRTRFRDRGRAAGRWMKRLARTCAGAPGWRWPR
jgi:hypothetical protein